MERLNKFFDLTLRYALEPGLNWVLEHPIISVVVVVALTAWTGRRDFALLALGLGRRRQAHRACDAPTDAAIGRAKSSGGRG